MDNDRSISVIIPARDEAGYISSCLKAITKHENVRYICEIIVIDNNSDDATAAIAADYGCIVLSCPVNSPAVLRNVGVERARGTFLAFIDADCVVPENWCALLLGCMDRQRVVACGLKNSPDLNRATWVEWSVFHLNSRRGEDIQEIPHGAKVRWLGTSNLLIRSEPFRSIGGFNEVLVVAEDYDLCERLERFGDIVLLTEPYTVHLRESKTLVELFKRELWRGKNSWSHWKNKGYSLYELPSIVIPFGFLVLLVTGLIIAFTASAIAGGLFIGLDLIGVTLLVAKKMTAHEKRFFIFIPCMVVQSVYLLARGTALVGEFFHREV